MLKDWIIDEDLWYTRHRKPGEPEIKEAASFGFTLDDAVYVRSAEFAAMYDKGITKEPQP